jgi:DNA repair and recombination protein RAD54B
VYHFFNHKFIQPLNVLYRRKFTTKKNKTWDGDGVLSVIHGYAHLQDTDGREMGKTMWKAPLLPGSTLSVGGKDVEVDTVISEADFLAGRPFLGGKLPDKAAKMAAFVAPKPNKIAQARADKLGDKSAKHNGLVEKMVPAVHRISNTKFRNPLLGRPDIEIKVEEKVPQPRHSLDAPGALVMKRPQSVRKGKQIVDVVVDPVLSRHLREHQRQGVQFMYECVMGMRESGEGAILADEMGLGKTLQTIALLWTLLKQNPTFEDPPVVRKALIVCPVTLINNWKKEFRKWLGNDRLGVFVMNDKKARITDFTKGKAYNVMIIGYEKLRLVQDELKNGAPIDIVIADEGHRLKTAHNKAAMAIKSLSTERRIILSGTPLQNDLGEFYTMVDFVNPGLLGKYNTFKKEFETPMLKSRQPNASKGDIEKGEARSEELGRLVGQFVLRRSAEVIAQYLPPKTEIVLFCRPTAAQAALYRAVLESPMFSSVLGSSDAYLQLINILKKLCNSPSLLTKSTTDDGKINGNIAALLSSLPPGFLKTGPAASAKLQVLDSLLHQLHTTTDEKVVLVSNYTSTLDILGNLLSSLGHTFLRLDGSTPAGKRQDLVDRFNNTPRSTCFAFLLSAKAGGAGINLIGASRLVLFDVDWNPATDLQAMARIHRDGQKKPCFIYRMLIKGAMDEKIYQRQVTKSGLADAVVDSKKTSQTFTAEELRDLFSLDESDGCKTHDLLGCDCGGKGNAPALEPVVEQNLDAGPTWGANMDDSAADFDEGENEDLPGIGTLIKASQVNMEEQERLIRQRSRKPKTKDGKEKIQALMKFLHIDAGNIRAGDEEMESLVEDQMLLTCLKEEGSRIAYVFAKTTS